MYLKLLTLYPLVFSSTKKKMYCIPSLYGYNKNIKNTNKQVKSPIYTFKNLGPNCFLILHKYILDRILHLIAITPPHARVVKSDEFSYYHIIRNILKFNIFARVVWNLLVFFSLKSVNIIFSILFTVSITFKLDISFQI